MSDPFGYGGGYVPNFQRQDFAMAGVPSSAKPLDRVSGGPDMMSKGFQSRQPQGSPQFGARVESGFQSSPMQFGGRNTQQTLNLADVQAKDPRTMNVIGGTAALNPLYDLSHIGAKGMRFSGFDPRQGAEDLLARIQGTENSRELYKKVLPRATGADPMVREQYTLQEIQDLYSNAAAQMKGIYANPQYAAQSRLEGGVDSQLNYLQEAYNTLLGRMSQYGYL